MKKIITILLLLAAVALTVGCRRHKVIPDKELGQIFHDALLTNAYIDSRSVNVDSLNIYEPIFKRYGYTTDDVRYTIASFSRRKSARLSDVAEYMILLLDRESQALSHQVEILDTIENAARRRYTRTLLADSMINVTKAADTVKLRFVVDDVAVGDYTVSARYTLDSLDTVTGRRYRIYWQKADSTTQYAAGGAIVRRRDAELSQKFKFEPEDDYRRLVIDLAYFAPSEKKPLTRIKVDELKLIYTPPVEECVRRLFDEQTGVRIFSDSLIIMNEQQAAKAL